MNIFITIIAVAVGLFVILYALRSSKRKQLNEVQALMWLIGGAGTIFLGLFPEILMWFAYALEIYWPPSILVFFLLVIIFFMLFNHSKTVSTLTNQMAELTMQVSLLKHENEKNKHSNTDTNTKDDD